VIDEWSRESLAIEVDLSLTGERVKRVLERLGSGRGLPAVIQSDNGPEFTGRVLDQWAYERGVKLQFIEPGKPIQNALIERFNSRLREECLNEQVFLSLDDARGKIERWRTEYNRERPHSSLGHLTPEEFAAKNQMSSAIARTAWPADQELAGAVRCAPASDSNSTSATMKTIPRLSSIHLASLSNANNSATFIWAKSLSWTKKNTKRLLSSLPIHPLSSISLSTAPSNSGSA